MISDTCMYSCSCLFHLIPYLSLYCVLQYLSSGFSIEKLGSMIILAWTTCSLVVNASIVPKTKWLGWKGQNVSALEPEDLVLGTNCDILLTLILHDSSFLIPFGLNNPHFNCGRMTRKLFWRKVIFGFKERLNCLHFLQVMSRQNSGISQT